MKKKLTFKRLKAVLLILRYFIPTIRFNFKYLPFSTAIKFPFIFECGAKFYAFDGKISIETDLVKPGMIRFKSRNIGIYDSNMRFVFENHGHIIFKGGGVFKGGSALSVGPKGILTMGENFSIGPLNKIICLNAITIGSNSLFAWEIIIIDSDFHSVYNFEKNTIHDNSKSINIGDNCWIGTRAMIYKGTVIPHNTIVAGMTILNKDYNIPSYSLLAGSPAEVKKTNICRLQDDRISNIEIENVVKLYNDFKLKQN